MSDQPLHGVVVPVITPIDEDENVDEAAFRRVIRRLIGAGVHGLFVGGSAGEGPLLATGQWRRMAGTALEEAGDALPVLCGVMETSTRRACERIRTLRDVGFRRFVLTPTFYLTVRTDKEYLRHFGQAKEAAGDMEMAAYNIPQCTGSCLPVLTVREMAARGWIRCCKESSGDLAYLTEMVDGGREVGLRVLVGDEAIGGQALLAGARGIVPVCANYDPWTFVRLYEAAVRGDSGEVARQMARVTALRQRLVLSGPCWLAGVKYALAALGIGSGRPASPLEPADAQRRAVIEALVRQDAFGAS